jgi:cardiolipin synthase
MINLPNVLTLLRIAAIIPIVGLFFVDTHWAAWTSFGLFSAAGITDFFDGYLARATGRVSKLGRFLDPIADKLLIASVLFMLVADGTLSGWHVLPGLVILVREITVSGLREFLAELRVSMPVSSLAKWKTTIQIFALGFLIVGDAGPEIIPCLLIGNILIWISAILTVVTGADYLRAGLRHMTD